MKKPEGQLYYVVGPSGVGKDSIIKLLRKEAPPSLNLCFAHRYITRPANDGSENHVELSTTEFQDRKSSGCFALAWESHGNAYGIGKEIDLWLEKGMQVIVNGSRAYLEEAKKCYPDLWIVLVQADEHLVRDRLIQRGRESLIDIEKRIERSRKFNEMDDPRLIRLLNNESLAIATQNFIQILQERQQKIASVE